MKTAEQYKKLTISEFTKAAEVYETDRAGLTRHVRFIRHSDLSDGDSCHDEVIRKR